MVALLTSRTFHSFLLGTPWTPWSLAEVFAMVASLTAFFSASYKFLLLPLCTKDEKYTGK